MTVESSSSRESRDEREPLVSPIESTTSQVPPSLSPSSLAPKKPWILLVVLLLALVAVIDIGAYLADPPKTRVYEANLCLTYYREHDPSVIDKHGLVPEKLCKVDEVQQKMAMIFGWQETFDAIPGMILAVPLGAWADRVGRKWILAASLVGLQLSSAWVLVICG